MSNCNEVIPMSKPSEEEDYSSSSSSEYDSDVELMLKNIPQLDDLFTVHHKLGEGTFSSVYMCTLKLQKHISLRKRKKFAVKYLIPTSHPDRMERELKCLQEIGGRDNVSGIELCLRNKDSVAFVMPCLPHNKYQEYMFDMDHKETQVYMKNLLLAVCRVHSFGIIHRDIKPSNFLYDRANGRFLLVDFGLAQHIDNLESRVRKLKQMNVEDSKKKRKRSSERENSCDEKDQQQKKTFADPNKLDIVKSPLKQLNIINSPVKLRKPPTFNFNVSKSKSHIKHSINKSNRKSIYEIDMRKEAIGNSLQNVDKEKISNSQGQKSKTNTQKSTPSKQTNRRNIFLNTSHDNINNFQLMNDSMTNNVNNTANGSLMEVESSMANRTMSYLNKTKTFPSVESVQSPLNMKIKKEIKSPIKSSHSSQKSPHLAPVCSCYGRPMVCNACLVRKTQVFSRAGTPGFRPPEVLLRYPKQTTAVDIWACGVTFLCILSRCYPFFRAADDFSNLAEIIALLGLEKVRKAAHSLERQLIVCSKAKIKPDYELNVLCKTLRGRLKEDGTSGDLGDDFPQSAYDLLVKLLDPNPYTRITAEEALKHDFFKEIF